MTEHDVFIDDGLDIGISDDNVYYINNEVDSDINIADVDTLENLEGLNYIDDVGSEMDIDDVGSEMDIDDVGSVEGFGYIDDSVIETDRAKLRSIASAIEDSMEDAIESGGDIKLPE